MFHGPNRVHANALDVQYWGLNRHHVIVFIIKLNYLLGLMTAFMIS